MTMKLVNFDVTLSGAWESFGVSTDIGNIEIKHWKKLPADDGKDKFTSRASILTDVVDTVIVSLVRNKIEDASLSLSIRYSLNGKTKSELVVKSLEFEDNAIVIGINGATDLLVQGDK